MQLILLIWAIHAAAAAVLTLPIVLLGRNRVHWYAWELLAFVLPFCVWWTVQSLWSTPSGKGLGNLIEPVYFGLAIPIAAMIRVIGGKGDRTDESIFAAVLLAGLCAAAAITYFVTPNLRGSIG